MLGELSGRQSGSLHVAKQRERDLAVLSNALLRRHALLAVDGNGEKVARCDPVIVGFRGRSVGVHPHVRTDASAGGERNEAQRETSSHREPCRTRLGQALALRRVAHVKCAPHNTIPGSGPPRLRNDYRFLVVKLLLMSPLLATFLLPVAAASGRKPLAALRGTLIAVVIVDVAYAVFLRFFFLRFA